MRAFVESRVLVAFVIAAAVGTWGVLTFPLPADNVFLALIRLQKPAVFAAFAYGYAAMWFTTPFIGASLVTSLCAIVVYRYPASVRFRPLPPYPVSESRAATMLVLGETHHATISGRAPAPGWLTITQRGLYTGMKILGAVVTG